MDEKDNLIKPRKEIPFVPQPEFFKILTPEEAQAFAQQQRAKREAHRKEKLRKAAEKRAKEQAAEANQPSTQDQLQTQETKPDYQENEAK